MQLFGSTSEEGNNTVETLKIINTSVKRLKYCGLSLPHMGWNNVSVPAGHFLFKNIKANNYFYFAHNYIMKLCKQTISYTNYGELFSAAVEHNNFFGVQFHPEKSGMLGQRLIKNFLEL